MQTEPETAKIVPPQGETARPTTAVMPSVGDVLPTWAQIPPPRRRRLVAVLGTLVLRRRGGKEEDDE
jgi:hypothetical protein